jgi:hypothetical protein
MAHFARLSETGLVLEVCCCEDIAQCFHPDIAKEFREAPEGAEPGDTVEDGKLKKAPAPAELPAPAAPVEKRLVSKAEFMSALTRGERIALTDLSGEDAELRDFLAMLEALGHLDLDNQDDIALLERLKTAGVLSEASVQKITESR